MRTYLTSCALMLAVLVLGLLVSVPLLAALSLFAEPNSAWFMVCYLSGGSAIGGLLLAAVRQIEEAGDEW